MLLNNDNFMCDFNMKVMVLFFFSILNFHSSRLVLHLLSASSSLSCQAGSRRTYSPAFSLLARSSFKWRKITCFVTSVCLSAGFLIKFYVDFGRIYMATEKQACACSFGTSCDPIVNI